MRNLKKQLLSISALLSLSIMLSFEQKADPWVLAIDDKYQIATAEKKFYESIKAVDKEQHRGYNVQFKRMFLEAHSSPYQLYREFILIKQKSKKEATKKAIATGYKERMYYLFIGKIEDQYTIELMNRYKMSIAIRNAFHSNYCSCYRGKIDNNCIDGHCKLEGGSDW